MTIGKNTVSRMHAFIIMSRFYNIIYTIDIKISETVHILILTYSKYYCIELFQIICIEKNHIQNLYIECKSSFQRKISIFTFYAKKRLIIYLLRLLSYTSYIIRDYVF